MSCGKNLWSCWELIVIAWNFFVLFATHSCLIYQQVARKESFVSKLPAAFCWLSIFALLFVFFLLSLYSPYCFILFHIFPYFCQLLPVFCQFHVFIVSTCCNKACDELLEIKVCVKASVDLWNVKRLNVLLTRLNSNRRKKGTCLVTFLCCKVKGRHYDEIIRFGKAKKLKENGKTFHLLALESIFF